MARSSAARGESASRLAQLRQAFTFTRQADPRLVPLLAGVAFGVLAVFVGVGFAVGRPVYFSVIGVVLALTAGFVVFGRRVSAAMYTQVEGQPGAPVAVIQAMRGDWRVTPAVARSGTDTFVHRVLGRPGIVLLGEGAPSPRMTQLLAQERRRVARVAADTPVYDLLVGDADGQVPLRRLQRRLMKLPRNLRQQEVNAVESRMRALGGPNVPVPKGPLPRNARLPRGRMR